MPSRLIPASRQSYQPFLPLPERLVIPLPIEDGIYGFSSTGLTVMKTLPKRPSELLAIMSEQYEHPEYDQFGREVRRGQGKRKPKSFFRAHLTWYGIEYSDEETKDELEDALWDAMSEIPPPGLPEEIYAIEAEMRELWLSAADEELGRTVSALLTQSRTGMAPDADALMAQLTGASTLTDDFFNDPRTFFRTHFPAGVARSHVIVLKDFDTMSELAIYEWACDRYGLLVEKVENDWGRGRNRGRFADFVVGKDHGAVGAKAHEMRREQAQAGTARFRPY